MKSKLIIFTMFFAFIVGCNDDSTNENTNAEYPIEIASAYNSTCSITNKGALYCWGKSGGSDINSPEKLMFGFTPMPTEFSTPRNIKAGQDHYCMETDQGLKCWGNNYSGQSDVPESVNSVSGFALSEHETCAIQNERISCWGLDWPLVPQDYEQVKNVWGGGTNICLISGTALECPDSSRASDMPDFSALPTTMRFSSNMACAVVENRVICWNDSGFNKNDRYDNLQAISVSHNHGCAIASGHLDCWSSFGEDTPVLDINERIQGQVEQVAVGLDHICAIVSQEVICWGRDEFDYGTLSVPLMLTNQ